MACFDGVAGCLVNLVDSGSLVDGDASEVTGRNESGTCLISRYGVAVGKHAP